MAKKGLLVFVLVVFISGVAFAQFFVSAGVDTNFGNGAWPYVEIGDSLSNLDLLLGFGLYIATHSVDFVHNVNRNYSLLINDIGIYAGVAPKLTLPGNWSLTFPLLARVYYGSQKYDYDNSNQESYFVPYLTDYTWSPGWYYFGLAFRTGGKASYNFTENMSLYTGFLLNVVGWEKDTYDYWKGRFVSDGTEEYYAINRLYIFSQGYIQFGVKYTF